MRGLTDEELLGRVWDQRRKSFKGPWKRTAERVEYFVEALRRFGTQMAAAKAAGVSGEVARKWVRRRDIGPAARAALAEYDQRMAEADRQSQELARAASMAPGSRPEVERLRRQTKRRPKRQTSAIPDPWPEAERLARERLA